MAPCSHAGSACSSRWRWLADLALALEQRSNQSTDDIRSALNGPATVVVDAVGTSRTLQSAFDTSTLGARIVLVGMGVPRVEISAYAVSTEERTVLGSFSYDEAAFCDTAQWAGVHAAELETLIDARIDLSEAPDTFRALANGELTASKVLVYPYGHPDTHSQRHVDLTR